MNELIVELLNKYSNKGIINLNPLEFAEAIQTACKAQRNACWREYIDMVVFRKPGESEDFIKNAEITKEDYE